MVAAYHLIWTVYGVWLPNDPRGSGSEKIRCPWLDDLGEIHHGRKKIQPCSADLRKFYKQAKPRLKHETILLSDEEIVLVGQSFGNTIKNRGYTCYGCAVMPDHVHIVIRKHRDRAEDMIGFFQDDAWKRLIEAKSRPSDHPAWGGPGWKVYLDSCADIERTVRYVCDNPGKAGRPAQLWDFALEYDGWLPGIGARKK